jgi:hypothetical protein
VPIYELLKRQGSFDPDEVAVLGNVFEDVLKCLGLVDRQDPLTAAVAKQIIDLAVGGVRDPRRLKALTLQAFAGGRQPGDEPTQSSSLIKPR